MMTHCPPELAARTDPCSTLDGLYASVPEMPAECHWQCVSLAGSHKKAPYKFRVF